MSDFVVPADLRVGCSRILELDLLVYYVLHSVALWSENCCGPESKVIQHSPHNR